MNSHSSSANWFARIFEGSDTRAIVAAIVSISAVGAGLGLEGPLLSLLMERQGISSAVIGANTAVAGLAAMISIPFVTKTAQKFGVVNTMVACIFISVFSLLAFYFTDPLPMWFVWRFIISLALAMMFVLSEFWINYSANEKNRGIILGIYGTVLSLGFASGPAIVSIIGIDGILPFLIGAIIIALAAIPALMAKDSQPVMESKEKTPSIVPYLFVVPLATGAGFLFGAAEQSQLALLPVFTKESGFSVSQSALILTVLSIGNIVFQIPLGIWSDKIHDRRLILLFCTLVGIGGASLLPYSIANIWLLYLTVFLWGGAIGGLYIVGLAHLGSRLTGTDLAQANAAFVLCYAMGMTAGPQLSGILMDALGPNGLPAALGMMFVLYLALYIGRAITSRNR